MDFPSLDLEPWQLLLVIFLIPVCLMGYFMYSSTTGEVITSQTVMLLMGSFGAIMMLISPVYLIGKILEGEFLQGALWGFILFIVGFGLVLAWIYP